MLESSDEIPEAQTPLPPTPRRGRVLAVVGAILGLVGLGGIAFGTVRVAAAASLRQEADATASTRMDVEARTERTEERWRETTLSADELRKAGAAVNDGNLKILRSAGAVTRKLNGLVDAFNRSVDAFNAGNFSGGRAIMESEVDQALGVVARAVRTQDRRLAEVREGLAAIREARQR